MATKEHNKGAGEFSRSHPKITKSRLTNEAGNPVAPAKSAPPRDKNNGLASSMSALGGSRTITRAPVKRYETR